MTIATGVVAALTPLLKDDGSFQQIRKWAHKPGYAVRYRALIRSGLSAADRFYGEARGLSWRGFLTCFAFAVIYPFLLWQLAWAMNGPMTIGGVRGFDDSMSSAERWIGLALYWAFTFLLGVATWKLERLARAGGMKLWRHSWFFNLMLQVLLRMRGALAAAAGFLVGGVLLAGIGGVRVGVVAGFVGLAVAVAAGVGVTGFTKLGGVIVAVSVAFAFVASLGVVVVAAGFGGPVVPGSDIAHGGVVLATMLVLVPAANASLDHVSIQVSRWLLTDLIDRRGAAWQWLMVLGHVIADIIAAGVFLVVLAVLMPALLQLANCGFGAIGWPLVDWPLYLHAARTEPFGAGLLVTGMLLTTLIPTILHLVAAGVALALPCIGGDAVDRLADKASPTLLDRLALIGLIALSVLLSWMALVLAIVILWEALVSFVGPVGVWLAELALDAGRMVGGPGAPAP